MPLEIREHTIAYTVPDSIHVDAIVSYDETKPWKMEWRTRSALNLILVSRDFLRIAGPTICDYISVCMEGADPRTDDGEGITRWHWRHLESDVNWYLWALLHPGEEWYGRWSAYFYPRRRDCFGELIGIETA